MMRSTDPDLRGQVGRPERRGEALRALFAAWLARRALASCDLVGSGARVVGSPYVQNLGRIEIGDELTILAVPVRSHLVTGPDGFIRLGDRVAIAHGAAVCSHASVSIGSDVEMAPFVMILDADFHGVMDRRVPAPARPIRIGHNVRIGAGAIVLRGAIIGDDVEIAPNSVVSRRIPSGVRAGGIPARPLAPSALVG